MEYDGSSVLTDYVWFHCHTHMTDLERAGLKVVHAQFKAAATDNEGLRRTILGKWASRNDPDFVRGSA